MLENGARVRILVRDGRERERAATPEDGALVRERRERGRGRAADLESAGAEIVRGDLDSPAALERLVAGTDAIIHCAGAVRGGNYRNFEAVNVAGTGRLIDAALRAAKQNTAKRDAAVDSTAQHDAAKQSPAMNNAAAQNATAPAPRFILISSLAAREPGLSWYARSKHESELLLHRRAGELRWTILRPPPVYGPGDKEMLPLFRHLARGFAFAPGDPGARFSLIHIDDFADACLAILKSGDADGACLELADPQPGGYDWHQFAAIGAAHWRRPVRVFRLPRALLNMAAAANLLWSKLAGRPPMLTPGKLRELRHPDWTADNREITARCNWQPRIGLQEGLCSLESILPTGAAPSAAISSPPPNYSANPSSPSTTPPATPPPLTTSPASPSTSPSPPASR